MGEMVFVMSLLEAVYEYSLQSNMITNDLVTINSDIN